MIPLTTRTKQAIKIGLSMAIAMGIALWMDWEKPYWAGFAVAMISLDTAGQSLNKAAMRMLGTLVAIVAALTFIAWFGQQRWWFMAVLSLYVGFCAYMMTGKKRPYFWYVSGFVCVVIAVDASHSLTAFQIAVERFQETGMGILVYSLVGVLLWPRSSRDALEDAGRRLSAVQGQLYRAYCGLMRGEGRPEDSRPQRVQELSLLKQVEQLLNAAETESYEVWEVRHQWRRFRDQSTALMKTFEHWRASLAEVERLDLETLLPNLDDLWCELDLRFVRIERMLGGQAPDRMPQAVTLAVDKAEMRALTRFQASAVVVTKSRLDRLEALSRSLVDCVRDLRGDGGPTSKPLREETSRRGLAIDPDRLQGVIPVLATLWISFLILVYIDPPGHASFVMMSTTMAMVIVMSGTSPTGLALTNILGALIAGILYVFVMPHLAGYGQLGLMIFAVTFGISYLFSEPRQVGTKSAVLAMFVNNISVQNEQTYSFASYANSLTMIILMGALFIATGYIPTSPRPEKMFLQRLRRFFRQAEYLMTRLALDQDEQKKPATRWRMTLYRKDLLEIPDKLAALGRRIDNRLLSRQTPEQVQALATSLQALAYRINELVEVRKSPQAYLLVAAVIDDTRAWRMLAQKQFRLWADYPALAVEPGVNMRDRLAARIAGLEAQIGERLRVAGEEQLSEEDYENFYRYLGAFRGLSEAAVLYLQKAQGINWAQWEEERF
jgi:uncharacterized membrane protein YccC